MLAIPSRDPDIHRQFQLTDLRNNNNKFWTIKAWNVGGHWVQRTEYARAGYSPQTNTKQVTSSSIHSLIASKLRKGYVEVDLARVDVAGGSGPTTGDPEVDSLIFKLFREADEYIGTYLNTTVDKLSMSQIARGEQILSRLRLAHEKPLSVQIELAEEYYNTIPTRLPSRIRPESVVRSLTADLHEQFERLDQLKSAIRSHNVEKSSSSGVMTAAEIIGADLRNVTDTLKGEEIIGGIRGTWSRAPRGMEVWEVTIPDERSRFSGRTRGQNILIMELYHGSKSRNFRHILNGGLIIPKAAAHGSNYGRGIYFADKAEKSSRYCGGNMTIMLIVEVDVGRQYHATSVNYGMTLPSGYDSVVGGTQFKEYIVYQTDRQTITHLAVL